ncbi:MAG: hypothetical protein ACREO4_08245 [Lysobacter sp.]
MKGFVPRGWALEFAKRGDLDEDEREDAVMVLRMRDPHNVLTNEGFGVEAFNTNPRMLVVVFATGDGYRLMLQDGVLIPRADSPTMDDYLDGEAALGIRRGAFTVTLHAWASMGTWSASDITFTFSYQDDCFGLIGYDSQHLHRGSGALTNISINYVTRQATIATGNIGVDEMQQSRQIVPGLPRRCLSEVGDGFAFDPELRSAMGQGD